MTVWQGFGLALAAAVLCMAVRAQQPQLASLCALAAGLLLIGLGLSQLGDLRALFTRLSAMAGLREGYLQTLIKALGVGYAAELAGQICADLGENGLAAKVGLMGKLCVFALCAPMMMTILEMLLELAP